MSNIFLTAIAFSYAESEVENLIKEYNKEDLTKEGKLQLLIDTLAFAYMRGFKTSEDICKEEIVDLQNQLDQQKFNNKHNLSIDQSISDKMENLEALNDKYKKALHHYANYFNDNPDDEYNNEVARDALDMKAERKDN